MHRSFYFFHNDFLKIVELQNYINKNTEFVFKQLLIWDKYHGSEWNQLNAVVHSDCNRNYSKQCEYCLYYTFQDETGLTTVMLDTNNFSTLRKYFKELQEWLSITKKQIIEKVGQKADHCFRWGSSQWDLPTKETYQELINMFNVKSWTGFREYEDLRQEYEDLRYVFNNQKIPSVMQFEPVKQNGHLTPKNVSMLEVLIKTSSNECDIVLDCFMGSGSTGVACVNTGRKFIGMELDETYYEIACERIHNARKAVTGHAIHR